MGRYLVALIASGAAMLATGQPHPCAAGWCPTYKCLGPCGECPCMIRYPEDGVCVDIESVPLLEAQGWTVLP